MGWGIILGSAAKAGMDTFTKLGEEERADEKLQLAKNADARAAAAEGRAAQSFADEQDALAAAAKALDPNGGAPVVNPNATVDATSAAPVAVKSDGPMRLGGPKPMVIGPNDTPYTPPDDPKAAGIPTGAKTGAVSAPQTPAEDEADEQARARAATSSGSSAAGLPRAGGSRPSDRLLEAFRSSKRPNKKLFGMYLEQKDREAKEDAEASLSQYRKDDIAARNRALDLTAQEQASVQKFREIQGRAAEHQLTREDVAESQAQAAKAAGRATASLENYKDFSGDVAATDPRVVEATKGVMHELEATHSAMADGQTASWEIKPDGVHVSFKDAKTGKEISSQVLGTVKDVRDAVQQMGMATDPANYPKLVGNNTLTKIANEVQGMQVKAGVDAARFKGQATDAIASVAKGISDPTGASLLDEKSLEDLKTKAHLAAILAPDLVEYDKKVPMIDEATGAPKLDDHGRPVMMTVKGNRLSDVIDFNTPSKTTRIQDPKTGQILTQDIDTAVKITLDNYEKILKETPNQDPAVAQQAIRKSLLDKGYDQRTVDFYLPKIMQAGAAKQAAGLKAGSVPASTAMPSDNRFAVSQPRGPRGGAIPTERGPGVLTAVKRGLHGLSHLSTGSGQ